MQLQTRHFGEIMVELEKVINFRNGLPGFEELNRFILLSEGEESKDSPLVWLQSIDDPKTAFVMMDVGKLYPEYDPLVNKDTVESELGQFNAEHFFVYNIATIPENISEMTVNLKAPVIINDQVKKGMQIICDNEDYSVRHFVFK